MFDERKDITIEKTIDGNKNQFDQVKRENCTVVIFPGRRKRQEINFRTEKEVQAKIGKVMEISDDINQERINEILPDLGAVGCLKQLDNDEVLEDVTLDFKTSEDSGEYIGHCRPKRGTGIDRYEADVSNLKIVLTDGTSKMTGCKTGAVAVLERRLGHVLQRSGCMLHHVEKPYEHLHEYYDGVTTGPATFSGPIGIAIEGDVWKLEVGNFIPVLNPLLLTVIREIPQEVIVNLSRDISSDNREDK